MTMKLIGITGFESEKKVQLNQAYINAFSTKRTIPVIIPPYNSLGIIDSEIMSKETEKEIDRYSDELANKLDCLVLSGGGDLNPMSSGGRNVASYSCDSIRDYTEISLMKAFISKNKSILGVCRGMQLIGRYFGLPLCQHISQENIGELHNASDQEIKGRSEPCHSIMLLGDFKEYIGQESMKVNSFHHQALMWQNNGKGLNLKEPKKLPEILAQWREQNHIEILAGTPKIIEAFRHTNLPIFSVQFHLEEYKESVALGFFFDKFLFKKEVSDFVQQVPLASHI